MPKWHASARMSYDIQTISTRKQNLEIKMTNKKFLKWVKGVHGWLRIHTEDDRNDLSKTNCNAKLS